jgi:GMC oxidoreductase
VSLKSADPFAQPAVAPNFLGTPEDTEKMAACVEREREILSKMPESFVFNETNPADTGSVGGVKPTLQEQVLPMLKLTCDVNKCPSESAACMSHMHHYTFTAEARPITMLSWISTHAQALGACFIC